jgi:HK97 gp10 family phage protein
VSVDVSQFNQMAAELEKAGPRVGAAVSQQVRKTAKAVEASAKAGVPVKSGALRDSIDTKIFGTGNSKRTTAVVRAGTDHARFVEEGTSRQAPQPFMKPALDQHTQRFMAGIGKAVGEGL